MQKELGEFKGKDRIFYTGLMPYVEYKKLLQRSNLHCYFTRPYVPSWSLFEAAACGARLCVNTSDATRGIVENEEDVVWIDLENLEETTAMIILKLKENNTKRASLKTKYNLDNCLKEWQCLINEQIQKRT